MEEKKITKTILERYYAGFMFYDSTLTVVDHNDPTKVELEKDLVKFRFYDQEYIITPEGEKEGLTKNSSPIYFTGKKLTAEEFISKYSEKYANTSVIKQIVKTMQEKNLPFVCVDENDMVHYMSQDDTTVEDYIKSKQDSQKK